MPAPFALDDATDAPKTEILPTLAPASETARLSAPLVIAILRAGADPRRGPPRHLAPRQLQRRRRPPRRYTPPVIV
jgi:hypothetical protein